jgi:hypothetical protein
MKQLLTVTLALLLGCQTRQEPHRNATEISAKPDSTQQLRQDSIAQAEQKQKAEARLDSLAAIVKAKPIWGERRKVIGDFDGDGALDTLYERYISRVTGKETNKDYDWSGSELGDDVDWLFYKQKWVAEKDPLVRLESKNPAIKPFDVEWGGCQNGFDYLKNVGDLNGDSTDEIAYYIYDVDMSMMNSCALATYKNGKWKELHHWGIMELDFIYEEGEPKPDPIYVRKKNGKVYCKERDWEQGGDYAWKPLKINW